MISTEKTKDQRIANRYFLINSLEEIIKESVYYRSYSHLMIEGKKVATLNVELDEVRAQL